MTNDPRLTNLWEQVRRAEAHLDKQPVKHQATCGATRIAARAMRRIAMIQKEEEGEGT